MSNDPRLDYATPMPPRKGPGCMVWFVMALGVVVGFLLVLVVIYFLRMSAAVRSTPATPAPTATSPAGQ